MQKYQDIRAILQRRITAGDWRPGEQIPREADLAREFGVTRPTVGRALRDLAEAGLLERRRRAGTRVALPSARAAQVTIPLVRQQIAASGGAYRYLLLSRAVERCTGPARATFGLGAGEKALHIRCLHYADGRPWQLEDRWIHLGNVPDAAEERFDERSPNEWLIQAVPFTSAEHVFRAAMPSETEARDLALAPAEPIFEIARTTWLEGLPITTVRLLHPGNSFALTSHDTRDGGGRMP